MEIEKLLYKKDDYPSDLFKFCLDNKLYREDNEKEEFVSRMKKTYNKEFPYYGVSATIAYEKDEPIGICMIDHRVSEDCDIFYKNAGMLYCDNRERKNPWRYQYDFHILHIGFMMFYVKPEFRNKGVAQELLVEMEKLQLDRIKALEFPKKIKDNISNSLLTVTVREKARDILSKSTVFSAMHGDITDGCFKTDISKLSYDVVFNEKTEKCLVEIVPDLCDGLNILAPIKKKTRI